MTFYLETHSHDPAYNLAFEEYVFLHRKTEDYLLLWQNAPAVIIGQNQNTLAEIDHSYTESHNISVVRRTTGGGAVYHDLGNINYSFITDAHTGADSYRRFTDPVIRALCALGLHAEVSGRNDILADGCKISGTAQRISGTRILYHGTLLFDSDLEVLTHVLRPDPEKLLKKGVASVRSRVTNIRSLLPSDMTIDEFWTHLRSTLISEITETALTDDEKAAVLQLKREKYDIWDWNFGHSPQYELHRKKYLPGGMLDVSVQLTHEHISQLSIYGDFLATAPITPLLDALIGCPFTKPALSAVLQTLPLSQYLGAITAEEFISLLFEEGTHS